MSTVIQYILYLAVLVVLAIPLGAYIKKVMNGEKTFLSKILTPAKMQYIRYESHKEEQMNWKKYEASVLSFFRYRACVPVFASAFARRSARKPAGVVGS